MRQRLGAGGPPGRWIFWTAFSLYAAGLGLWLSIGALPSLAAGIPGFHHYLQHVAASGGFASGMAARIASPSSVMARGGRAAEEYLFSILNVVLGVLLVVRRPHERVPRLLVFALLGTAATFNIPSHQVFHVIGEPTPIKVVHFTFHIVSGTAYWWAVVLFPDNRLPPGIRLSRGAVWLLVVTTTAAVSVISWRGSYIAHPQFFAVFFGIAIPAIAIPAQTLRIRRDPHGVVAHQAALLRAALVPALGVGLGWLGAWVAGHVVAGAAAGAASIDLQLQTWFPAAFAVVPVVLFVAVLRYRLWDIDVLLSRTLMYTALVAAAAVAYALVVAGATRLVGSTPWAAVLAMTVVGVGLAPLLGALRSGANRLIFGQSLTPTEAMQDLAATLQRMSSTGELTELARVAQQGTRATAARVWVLSDQRLDLLAGWPADTGGVTGAVTGPGDGGRVTEPLRLSEAPVPFPEAPVRPTDGVGLAAATGDDVALPVWHHGELLGALSFQLPPGVRLSDADRWLAQALADHAGMLLHNARLAVTLAQHVERLELRTEELRRARTRLVQAHDQERRRLEHDLHDGAQQDLVALLVTLRTAGQLPAGAAEQRDLLGREQVLADTIGERLSSLCRDEYPAILVHQGLEAAVGAAATSARRAGVEVTVRADLVGRAPLDVETAVYYCCVEALQNVVKHARAASVRIDLALRAGALEFEVADDGRGFDPRAVPPGSGLTHFQDRLTFAGGVGAVETAPGHGTRVRGSIPVRASGAAMAEAPVG